MSKSSRRSVFGSNNKGQTVTVIEAPTRYSQRRKAIIAFFVILFTDGLLTGTVASHYMHPILGGLLGIVTGAVLGAIVFVLIIAWPVLRILWWWLPEITIGLATVYGWTWLMVATPLWLSLVLVTVGVGLPAIFRRSRYWVLAPAWCLIVRHRLRMCFAAFIATNREGTLPLILWARPTPAGERVWIWLRPGLSIRDLEQDGQVQKLAVACWANEARVTRASRKYAALIRVDITRREPLADTVLSNLPGQVPDGAPATTPVVTALPPTGVNLADVPNPRPKRASNDNETRPRRTRPETASDDFDPSDYA
ncbi:hypothetical protein ACIBSW_14065 [Actinoplanes sp. NPDC049668]|uniref:hypothetical protein n=1 Tax=unclassified Actinoplanes TaxID=2626549 RepID=UPI0033AAD38B